MGRGGALGGVCAGRSGGAGPERGRAGWRGAGPAPAGAEGGASAEGAGLRALSGAGLRGRTQAVERAPRREPGLDRLHYLQALRDLITVSNLLGCALLKGLPTLKTTTEYEVAYLKMV